MENKTNLINKSNLNGLELLFLKKPVATLLALDEASKIGLVLTASQIAKMIDCTYTHVLKITREFYCADFIDKKKTDRRVFLTLTDKGSKIIDAIKTIHNEME